MTDLVRLLRSSTFLGGLADVRDERVPGRPGPFTPIGVMDHHTAAGTNVPGNRRTLQDGRPDLRGPLCNVYVRRDGVVEVITDDRANDSGSGSSRVLEEVRANAAVHQDARDRGIRTDDANGNPWFYDVEIDNRGTGEPYPAVQIRSVLIVNATLLDHLGRTTGSLIYHRFWTYRKIDPFGVPDLIGMTARVLRGDMEDHDHNLTGPMPDWAVKPPRWQRFVDAGVTSVEDSWRWVATRLDLAWVWHDTILPLGDAVETLTGRVDTALARIAALTRRVTAIEGGTDLTRRVAALESQLSKLDVDRLAAEAERKASANLIARLEG